MAVRNSKVEEENRELESAAGEDDQEYLQTMKKRNKSSFFNFVPTKGAIIKNGQSAKMKFQRMTNVTNCDIFRS